MFPRQLLRTLVFGLAVLVVAFAVVMGGYALTSQLADKVAAHVFLGIGIGLLVLIVIDILLLLIALGIESLARSEDHRRE